MNHRVRQRKLNRTPSHHRAMQRNMAQSLIEHGQIRTTLEKAKDLRPFVERLVTLARSARRGSVTARRQIHKILSDRSFIPAEHQTDYEDLSLAKRKKALRAPNGRRYRNGKPRGAMKFTGESITHRLINTIAEQYAERAGGYTRLIRLAKRRIGDGGRQAILQFVGEEESPGSITKPAKSSRQIKADSRYALAVSLAKQRRGGQEAEDVKPAAAKQAAPEADETSPDNAAE
ncbi:MAG TPA: 50S ribosomal protein L17 [Phycisphaerae bacterium]|nr:50S ribosomal protein L17 [Phycisphaerales bacterium]HNO76777.1 50S ribosomal protein L17 [Phycisphaerae bacterium]